MTLSEKLKKYLQMVVPHIKGKWFISDGALLGIKRHGGLIDYDDDIDLFIFPDTIIDYDKIDLKFQEDYMCNKLYNESDKLSDDCRGSDWKRFISYKTSSPELQGFNRADIMSIASTQYKSEIMPNINCSCWIDVFLLEDDPWNKRYVVPWYFGGKLFYYNYDELELVKDSTLGFDIWIPNNHEAIFERMYGLDWRTPNKNFKW
tara:strand:- start:49 stop:660 length:612 start_codon:yes stop_codon:yes gene_type:complete